MSFVVKKYLVVTFVSVSLLTFQTESFSTTNETSLHKIQVQFFINLTTVLLVYPVTLNMIEEGY